jgi:solute carrier family 25 phosphate transporter 3
MSGDKHDLSYFAKCMTGGALACGLTHVLILPLDLVKCRRQVQPNLYKGIYDGFSKIKATEGILGLGVGWIPTLIGYSMQGAVRFGFYEIFKDI